MINFMIYGPVGLLYNDLLFIYSDRNEIKNRMEMEWYAQNREEILKRQRQTRKQNKHIAAVLNGSNIVSHMPATGQLAVTQLQNITCAGGVVSNSMHFNRDILDEKENIYEDDESNGLHRNDAYQMQRISRQMTLTQMSNCLRTPNSVHSSTYISQKSLKKKVSSSIF